MAEWHGRSGNKIMERAKNGLKGENPQSSKARPLKERANKEWTIRKMVHAIRGQGQTAEYTDKPLDHSKRMSSRQASWHTLEVENAQGPGTTNLYLANTRVVSYKLEVRKGMVWWWGEEKAYSRIPTHILLRVMSCWDDIPPKRRKDKLKPLGTHHWVGARENATVIKQTK